MSNEDFNALVELMRAIAQEAVRDAKPAHSRSAKNSLEEDAIEWAHIRLVQRYEADE